MHRLQVLVSKTAYEQLRSFAPEHGAGAILEHMIERECGKRARRAEKSEVTASQAKVVA